MLKHQGVFVNLLLILCYVLKKKGKKKKASLLAALLSYSLHQEQHAALQTLQQGLQNSVTPFEGEGIGNRNLLRTKRIPEKKEKGLGNLKCVLVYVKFLSCLLKAGPTK